LILSLRGLLAGLNHIELLALLFLHALNQEAVEFATILASEPAVLLDALTY